MSTQGVSPSISNLFLEPLTSFKEGHAIEFISYLSSPSTAIPVETINTIGQKCLTVLSESSSKNHLRLPDLVRLLTQFFPSEEVTKNAQQILKDASENLISEHSKFAGVLRLGAQQNGVQDKGILATDLSILKQQSPFERFDSLIRIYGNTIGLICTKSATLGALPKGLAYCDKIQHLHMPGQGLKDIQAIRGLSTLTHVNLSRNQITSFDLQDPKEMTEVILRDNPKLDPKTLYESVLKMPKLECLDVRGTPIPSSEEWGKFKDLADKRQFTIYES